MRQILGPLILSATAALAAAAPAGAATPSCAGGTTGTAARDIVVGVAGPDRIQGLAGDDVLRSEPPFGSSRARDCLDGGPGRDHLYGGDGRDVLLGGSGDDVIYGEDDLASPLSSGAADVVRGGPGADVIHPGPGVNDVDAGSGNDLIDAANGRAETVRCGAGRDRVSADSSDRLLGCERVRRLRSPFAQLSPRRGGRFAAFAVRWRTVSSITSAAFGSGDYIGAEDFVATVKPHRSPGCSDRGGSRRLVRDFRMGATITIMLSAPHDGWCPGAHRVFVHHRYTEDVSVPGADVCDLPESGSSQCETPPTDTAERDELLWRLTFRTA